LINRLKKISYITLPIALGVFLIWYSISKLSPADIQSIKTSFQTANYWWVALSIFFGILSHLSRAYRWQFLLEPLGYKPRFANSVMAVLIAYLLNLFIPRSGEIARAATIKKYENIPFEKAIGTIVAERVADVIMLFSITGVAFFLQTELMGSYLFKEDEERSIYLKIAILVLFPLLGIATYYFLKKSTHPFIVRHKKHHYHEKKMAVYFSHHFYLAYVFAHVLLGNFCPARNHKPPFCGHYCGFCGGRF